jgi:hypothetical protein
MVMEAAADLAAHTGDRVGAHADGCVLGLGVPVCLAGCVEACREPTDCGS